LQLNTMKEEKSDRMKLQPVIRKPLFAILLSAFFVPFTVAAQSTGASTSTQTVNSNSTQTIYSNVAMGKTATASSADDPGRVAKYAIDGSMNSRFSSSYTDNEWLSVDLGKAYLLNFVILTWEKSYGKDFNILFSNNGTFTDLYTDSIQVRNHVLTNNSVAGVDSLHLKSGTVARYVRMQGIHRSTVYGYSLWEMQVMGTTSTAGLFPVSITGFSAAVQNNTSLLEWNTITEYNNAGFSIERSSDAINFTTIGWINARNAGTVTTHYSFTDRQASGGRNYYRLKQTWLDGKTGYSPVIAINLAGDNVVNTYPVPVKDHLVVEYRGLPGESISVVLFNTAGLPVYSSKMQVQGGQQTMVINRTSGMQPGQYYLMVTAPDNKKYAEKIVLQ